MHRALGVLAADITAALRHLLVEWHSITPGDTPRAAMPRWLPQIMQPDLDEGVQQQPVTSKIYDRHKATLGDTLG
jgi:hypothetical protein